VCAGLVGFEGTPFPRERWGPTSSPETTHTRTSSSCCTSNHPARRAGIRAFGDFAKKKQLPTRSHAPTTPHAPPNAWASPIHITTRDTGVPTLGKALEEVWEWLACRGTIGAGLAAPSPQGAFSARWAPFGPIGKRPGEPVLTPPATQQHETVTPPAWQAAGTHAGLDCQRAHRRACQGMACHLAVMSQLPLCCDPMFPHVLEVYWRVMDVTSTGTRQGSSCKATRRAGANLGQQKKKCNTASTPTVCPILLNRGS
jgi:hypothetical protein